MRFEGEQPKLIINQGNLATGQDLTLAGGNLDLQGQLQAGRNLTLQATNIVRVRDSVTQPFIASALGKLLLQGNQGIDILALNHPNSGLFSGGDLVLRSANPVLGDAHYWSGGNFRIEQLDGSLENWFSLDDPIIRASGDVSFDSYTGASLHIFAGGSVEIPGTVTITQPDTIANSTQERVILSDGVTVVNVDGSAQPTLDIRAGTTAFATQGITGNTEGFSSVPELGGTGTRADIKINSIVNNGGVVFLTNQYQPNPMLSGGITVGSIDTRDTANGGPVVIDSRGGIAVNETVDASGENLVTGDFSGDGGDVTLLANGDITLPPGDIFSLGLLGGNITLKSQGDISIAATAESGEIASASFTTEPGTTGGDIKIMARSLSLSNSAQLNAVTFGEAQAGSIIIQVSETVSVDAFPSGAFSTVALGARGNGSNVTIETGRLKVTNEAQIGSGTFSSGDAGNLTVRAQSVEVSNSLLSTAVQPGATGNGGKLTIETESLLITDGGQVLTATFGLGDAGELSVTAESVELIGTAEDGTGSRLDTSVQSLATGNGGNLTIETKSLLVVDGAQIGTTTFGLGDAGELSVTAKSVELLGTNANGFSSGLFASALGSGDGGNLTILADQLIIRDGATISTSNFASNFQTSNLRPPGSGVPGNINVQARSILLDNQGTITAESAAGNQGNIVLQSQNILLRRGSAITTNALGDATGGNIAINADFIVAFPSENSDITANAFTGDGGRVQITAKGIFGIEPRDRLTPLSDITATSTFGLAGIVEINNPDIDPNQGLAKLQEVPQEVELAEGCQAADGQETVAFFNLGRGGLPPTPEEPFSSETIIAPWIPLVSQTEIDLESVSSQVLTNQEISALKSLSNWCNQQKSRR